MQKTTNQKSLWEQLELVIDPEMFISIVDLGLVYDVTVKNTQAQVTMTLTTLGCPLFPVIERDIEAKLTSIPGIDSVKVILTFDPPWTTERMSEKGKAILGI